MTSQPDKLFRDKLENFQRPAPVGAWDKIEKNLSKPSQKVVWMRIAAGIALLIAAAIVLWPAEKAEEGIAKTKTIEKKSVEPNDTVTQPDKKERIVPGNRVTQTQVAKTETVRKSKEQQLIHKTDVLKKDSVVINLAPEHKELIAEVAPSSVKKDESTTILYTQAEVSSKFLKKKLPPEATPENKDASGIEKLIGLAYAAKNSEAGLGDLRQKKDDLLALSFKKKKGEN